MDFADRVLYGIVDLGYVAQDAVKSTTSRMIEGGIDVIQLRAKECEPTKIGTLAEEIVSMTKPAGVPFIVNDHPEVAKAVGADGVHVGQDDARVDEVRNLLGDDQIVGKSTHSLAQAEAAASEAVDYIGFGPLFSTPTKPEYPAIGLEDIRAVHEKVALPIFCIGGVKLHNLPQVVAAGARRAVVVSEILQAPDIAAHVKSLRTILTSS